MTQLSPIRSLCKPHITKGGPELIKPSIGGSKSNTALPSRWQKNEMATPRAVHSRSMIGLSKLCDLPDVPNVTNKTRTDPRRRFQSDDPDQCVRFKLKDSEENMPGASILF